MSDTRSFTWIEITLSVLTLISTSIATFAAAIALPADAEIKSLQAQTQRLDLALKQADADLRNSESNRRLTLELYQEVKKVVENDDNTPREEEAVRVLVQSLAEDPLRYQLLDVMSISASDPTVKEAAAVTSKFFREQTAVKVAPMASAAASDTPSSVTDVYNVDIFYCESKRQTSEPLARKAVALKSSGFTGRWRLRILPTSINEGSGYRVSSNQIRFSVPAEQAFANRLISALVGIGINVSPVAAETPTPNYVSFFICE